MRTNITRRELTKTMFGDLSVSALSPDRFVQAVSTFNIETWIDDLRNNVKNN